MAAEQGVVERLTKVRGSYFWGNDKKCVQVQLADIDALLAVVEAAQDEHDERCACAGEACALGKTLAALHTEGKP